MAMCDESKTVKINSINEDSVIQTIHLPSSVNQIEFINKQMSLVMHNMDQNRFYVVDMDYPKKELPEMHSNVRFNLFRQLIQGSEDEQKSCIHLL